MEYMITTYRHENVYQKLTPQPDLLNIGYQNMIIFSGNFIHGEGLRNEISTGNSRIQLMIMERNMRISNCKMFYYEKFEYDPITAKDMNDYRFQVEVPRSRHSSENFRKSGCCSSRSQTL